MASMLGDGRGKRNLQRKTHVWKEGPQLSPLSSQNEMQQQEASGPPSGVKRKLQVDALDFVPSKLKQGKERVHHDNQSAAKEIPASDGESSGPKVMPEKHTLELILDVLQRRDTYEIFAEPVDPEKVEGYYEIVKEPMDFGTMRAKLHEGMYETLEQFEHDVFLIPANAMLFNSSGSVYSRQARAMEELAKKVFHVLKTDPENFELEFSGTRRRSCRRPQREVKDLNFNSSTRHVTKLRPSTVTNDFPSKGKPSSVAAQSLSRRNTRGIPGVASTFSDVDRREYALFSGRLQECLKNNGCASNETDRRSTYSPGVLFHNDNQPIFQKSPLLVDGNSYTTSLMLFAEGLGPRAEMVAKRKLQGLSKDAPTKQAQCPIQAAFASSTLSTWETDIMTSRIYDDHKVIDLLHGNQTFLKPTNKNNDGDKGAQATSKNTNFATIMALVSSSNDDKLNDKARKNAKLAESNSTTPQAASGSRNKISNITASSKSCWPSETAYGFSSFSKIGNDGNAKISRLGNSKSELGTSSTSPSDGRHRAVMMQSSSRFTFDMPFLKSQLNQMRVMGQQQQDRLLLRPSSSTFDRKLSSNAGGGNNNIDEGQGCLFETRGYIKVPVHFAEASSSTHYSTVRMSSFDTDLVFEL